MTRRELAALLVAVPAIASAAPAQAAPAQEAAKPRDPLAEAKEDIHEIGAVLAKTKLDITTEPAFRFRA